MRRATPVLVAVLLCGATCRLKPPREASREDLLEQADTWLIDFDDDEDGVLSAEELKPLLQSMMESSSVDPSTITPGAVSVKILMDLADANSDGKVNRYELVDWLLRMKGFDGGHIDRSGAQNMQKQTTENDDWAKARAPGTQSKTKKTKTKKRGETAAKDEM